MLTSQIEGIMTMSIGVLLYFMIPRSPKLAFFLDDTQRELAAARVEEELRHRKDESLEKGQIKRALLAPITWMCGLGFFLTNITVQSFSLFLVTPFAPRRYRAISLDCPDLCSGNLLTLLANYPHRNGIYRRSGTVIICPPLRLRLCILDHGRLCI
jgi:hypothetical protein